MCVQCVCVCVCVRSVTANGLSQLVACPTRGPYLLDLVLSNIPIASACVLHGVSDHSMVLTKVPCNVPSESVVQRSVWCFADADSARLAELVGAVSWDFIDDCSPDVAAESLCDAVLACMGTRLCWPSVRVQSLFSLSIS